MTRKEIESAYRVGDSGRILSPGKFEQEMVYAPHYYDVLCNGFADEDSGGVTLFKVTDEDRKEFPELREAAWVTLEENDVGFVYCSAHTKRPELPENESEHDCDETCDCPDGQRLAASMDDSLVGGEED